MPNIKTEWRNVIDKDMDPVEFLYTIVISYYGLAPSVYLWTVKEDTFILWTKRYPYVLDDLHDN